MEEVKLADALETRGRAESSNERILSPSNPFSYPRFDLFFYPDTEKAMRGTDPSSRNPIQFQDRSYPIITIYLTCEERSVCACGGVAGSGSRDTDAEDLGIPAL